MSLGGCLRPITPSRDMVALGIVSTNARCIPNSFFSPDTGLSTSEIAAFSVPIERHGNSTRLSTLIGVPAARRRDE